jgi:hypothetical protein
MKYTVDIDNTICETQGNDYPNSKPLLDRIQKINELYDSGHEIHYWTARGSNSGVDWLQLTLQQLETWSCKYTTAKTGKPAYDVWIDDKAINAEQYFK